MNDIICITPIFDRLELAVPAIRSVTDLGLPVIGLTDGNISFSLDDPKFSLKTHSNEEIVKNAFQRLKVKKRMHF